MKNQHTTDPNEQSRKRRERACLDKLFDELAKLGHPRPDTTTQKDKPDFLVSFPGYLVGVEVTLGVAEEYVRASKIQQLEEPSEAMFTHNLVPCGKRLTDSQLRERSQDPEQECIPIDQQDLAWKERNARVLVTKRKKLNQPDFRHFQKNWLLIVNPDRGHPTDFLAQHAYCGSMREILAAPVEHAKDFDSIFVVADPYFFWWEHEALRCFCDGREILRCKVKPKRTQHNSTIIQAKSPVSR